MNYIAITSFPTPDDRVEAQVLASYSKPEHDTCSISIGKVGAGRFTFHFCFDAEYAEKRDEMTFDAFEEAMYKVLAGMRELRMKEQKKIAEAKEAESVAKEG